MSEPNATTEQLMTRYLLGAATDNECVAVEERFLRDDEYLKHLRALECELIDDYVRGELPDEERRQFEQTLRRSPQRSAQVARARRMQREFDQIAAETSAADEALSRAQPVISRAAWWQRVVAWFAPTLQYGLAAAAIVLLLLGGAWVLRDSFSARQELARLRAERESLRQSEESLRQNAQSLQEQLAARQSAQQQLAEQLRQEQSRREQLQREVNQTRASTTASEPDFVALALTSGIERSSGEPRKLVVPKGIRQIRLQLEIDAAQKYRSYQVELATAGGSQVWNQSGLTAQTADWGRYVMVTIPARALMQSEYDLTLRGVTADGKREVAGYYYFIAAMPPRRAR